MLIEINQWIKNNVTYTVISFYISLERVLHNQCVGNLNILCISWIPSRKVETNYKLVFLILSNRLHRLWTDLSSVVIAEVVIIIILTGCILYCIAQKGRRYKLSALRASMQMRSSFCLTVHTVCLSTTINQLLKLQDITQRENYDRIVTSYLNIHICGI